MSSSSKPWWVYVYLGGMTSEPLVGGSDIPAVEAKVKSMILGWKYLCGYSRVFVPWEQQMVYADAQIHVYYSCVRGVLWWLKRARFGEVGGWGGWGLLSVQECRSWRFGQNSLPEKSKQRLNFSVNSGPSKSIELKWFYANPKQICEKDYLLTSPVFLVAKTVPRNFRNVKCLPLFDSVVSLYLPRPLCQGNVNCCC